MTNNLHEKRTVNIGNIVYAVRFEQGDVDGGCVSSKGLEKAEIKIALAVLRNNLPSREDLIFARKVCGISRDMVDSLFDYDFDNNETGTHHFLANRYKYINMLIDECLRQMQAIRISSEVTQTCVEKF